MTEINRQVRITAAPIEVAAALAGSPWRGAMTIDPAGAGCRVTIAASVEPKQLAESLETMALAEVCALQTRFGAGQTNQQKPKNPMRRTNMTTIRRTITIDAEADEVWAALADFGGIAAWNPNVKASKRTSTQELGEGVTRECKLYPMGTVQERITEWSEGRMMTIDIYEFQNVPAMRRSTAVIELSANGGRTTVTMSIQYEVGLGPVGVGMNAVVLKRQFEKAMPGVLAGLKHHVETGQTVDRKTDIPLAAVSA